MRKSRKSNETRREFLSHSGKALAATSIVAAGVQPVVGRVHVGGRETVRVGLIGCGGRGTEATMQALRADDAVELVAMADAFPDRLQKSLDGISKEFPNKVKVTDDQRFVGFDAHKQLLESPVDVVLLTTPPGFRPMHFEAAVKAGKHIFMEKPVAVDATGVRRVLAANKIAKEKNLIVQVGLQRRHERLYREMIDKLQNGAIGDINLMRAYWTGEGVGVRPREEQQTELEYQLRNWYYFNWLCGDHIVEQHIHNLDVINWLKNAYPVKAQGQGGRQVRIGKDYGQIYDHHMVEFTYADGSVMLSQCRHIPNCWVSVSEHAHGTQGTADISAGVIRNSQGAEVFRSQLERDGWQQEHRDLFADLRAGNNIPNEGDYGALSTMTAILGRMATYSGQEIQWDVALQLDDRLADVDSLHTFKDPAPLLPDEEGAYPVAMPGTTLVDLLRKSAESSRS